MQGPHREDHREKKKMDRLFIIGRSKRDGI